MSDDSGLDDYLEEGERVVGRVLVARAIGEDGGMRDIVLSDDGQGEELDMPTSVGMLGIAQHTMLCGCEQSL